MKLKIIKILLKLWHKSPELRFWQFLEYIKLRCKLPDDSFYITDEEFYTRLECFYESRKIHKK